MAVINNVDKGEQRVRNAFRTIMLQDSSKGNMGYAQAYAHFGLEARMTGEELRVQVVYALCNLQYWRGDEARKCKKVLKEYGGVR